jgi:DNA-binding NarL/FixJ family response regulator
MADTIRILLVDDDATARRVHADVLAEHDDVDVVTAESARDGLDRIADTDVDCVLSDLEMPGMDGIDFLESIREERAEFPFVLFTSRRSPETVETALEAGVSEFVHKHTCTDSYDLLVNRIKTVVQHYRDRRRLDRQERTDR